MITTHYGIREVAFYISALLTVVNLVILSLLSYFTTSVDLELSNLILIGILIFAIAFVILYFFLEQYISKRIKVIYKVINSTKLGGNPNLSDKDFYKSNSLDEVNTQVATWAKDTAEELETIKSLENYRKTYLGNISHELKTPLFSIQGYILTLLEGGMYDKKVLKKYLKKAANNAERLNNIINDLDYITSLESDGIPMKMQAFNIKDLIDSVIDDLTLQANARQINFKYKTRDLLDHMVYADSNAISQVLSNLIVNSIKYGKDEGTTSVGLYDMDTTILIEISDNGIGIEEKHHKHLFDRFFRVDKSRNRDIAGSGLGLSIVKHILEAHNQSISVRSTIDVGSTFGFTLSKASGID